MTIRWFVMLLAVIALFLAAAGVQTPRVNLFALGMALWGLSLMITV